MSEKPWGVYTVDQMFAGHGGPQAALPSGIYVQAVPEPYRPEGLVEKLRVVWWVFTGRAHAVIWPQVGDLERIMWGEGESPGSGGSARDCNRSKP